jgi:hypothetical protein
MSATTDRPLYFRSFEAALRPPATPTAGWGAVAERALQLLETPWPWDTSCTSMGVCPPGAACSQTTGFAIICAQGIVRDSVEPQLKAALDWWPTMLGGASDSEAHLVIVVLVAIALFNVAFVAHALASRKASRAGEGGASADTAGDTAARRQKDAAARRRRRRQGGGASSSDSGSSDDGESEENEDGDGADRGDGQDGGEIVAYKSDKTE